MSAADYEVSEQHILAYEGGYTNDPRDPGGPTNWGITIYDARLYWKHNATAADVRAMPLSVAKDIYRKKYWNALDCDELPAGLDFSVVDFGVNSGISRSGVFLRRCIGLPAGDWHVTHDVLDAIAKRNVPMLIGEFDDMRLHFLQKLGTWSHFGRGWATRVANVRATSLRMNAQALTAQPIQVAEVQQAGRGIEQPQEMLAHLSARSWLAVNATAFA